MRGRPWVALGLAAAVGCDSPREQAFEREIDARAKSLEAEYDEQARAIRADCDTHLRLLEEERDRLLRLVAAHRQAGEDAIERAEADGTFEGEGAGGDDQRDRGAVEGEESPEPAALTF
jgi:hypothetical protein